MRLRIAVMFLCGLAPGAWAQTPAPNGVKPPFPGFGTSLDQRPPGHRVSGNQTTTAPSLLPRVASSLTFNVRSIGNGGAATENQAPAETPEWQRKQGRTRVRRSQNTLEVKIRNLSAQPGAAQVDWYFLAEVPVPRGFRASVPAYVWDSGNRSLAILPGAEIQENLQSTELLETSTVKSVSQGGIGTGVPSYMTSQTATSGSRPVGWIVRLFSSDGKLIGVQASSKEFEKAAYDPNALALMQNSRPIEGNPRR